MKILQNYSHTRVTQDPLMKCDDDEKTPKLPNKSLNCYQQGALLLCKPHTLPVPCVLLVSVHLQVKKKKKKSIGYEISRKRSLSYILER